MRMLALAVALLVQPVWAQVPNVIGYHGRLLKSDGTPATGTVTMTFTFYDAPTAGAVLWTETQTVALTDGFYATYLGSVTALPSTLFSGADRFLEIQVNNVAMAPRLRAGSVPHALIATSARNVTGGTANVQSVSVSGVEVIDSTGKLVGPAAAVTQITATTPIQSSGGTTPTLSIISCASGEVLKSNGTGWACAADNAGSTSGAVTQITATAPIQSTGGTTPTLSFVSCASGEVLKSNGTGWACAADDGVTGTVVRSVTAGNGISITGAADTPVVAVNFGTGSTSVVRGDDDRLTPAGSITAYLGTTAPPGWVMADGNPASRTACSGLFAVVGTQYGQGDGSTTFNVPDLNSRKFLMGRSSAEGLGTTGGSWNHTHTVADHSHTMAHTHGMDHNHYIDHVHSMQGHIHTVNSHDHGLNSNTTGYPYDTPGTCASGTARDCGAHRHIVNGLTTASAPNTGAPNIANTGTSTLPTSGGSSIVNTNGSSSANTGLGGAQNTGTANPPYFAVNFIIKC